MINESKHRRGPYFIVKIYKYSFTQNHCTKWLLGMCILKFMYHLVHKILVQSDSYAFVRNGLLCTKWSFFMKWSLYEMTWYCYMHCIWLWIPVVCLHGPLLIWFTKDISTYEANKLTFELSMNCIRFMMYFHFEMHTEYF